MSRIPTRGQVSDFIERGRRGFSRSDVWSFDTYLAQVIAGGVRELAGNLHGCPPALVDGDDVDAGCERWAQILDEIAMGFEHWATNDTRGADDLAELNRSLDLLRQWWGHLWD